MKVEIEFTVDTSGNPMIRFRHLDKSPAMEQLLLGVFVKQAKANGLQLENPTGMRSTDGGSWEVYVIKTNLKD